MVVRVVIADDSLLVRNGVERLLADVTDLDIVGTARDFDEALQQVLAVEPDVLLSDIRMPPTGTDEGIRLASILRRESPKVGVLVLSQYVECDWALSLLEEGSAGRGYLLKDRVAMPDQLIQAIRDVADGGSVIDPLVVESLVAAKSRGASSPLSRLTPRELEVLAEIAQGKSNAGIATSLVLTQHAVEKHINSLFAKLDLGDEQDIHRRVRAVLIYLHRALGHKGMRPW
jgi:DNA-binding NarL/FixJ family response regulator